MTKCAVCTKLPVSLRAEIARRGRQGDSLRKISDHVTNEGHAIGRDGISTHLKQCVGVSGVHDGSDPATRSVLLAQLVVSALPGAWAGRLETIAHSANESGLTTEALVMQSHVPETMRQALAETAETPAHELLAARCLADACRRVLGVSHPEAARDIAADLAKQGADELASDLLFLADRATTHLAEASQGPAVGE